MAAKNELSRVVALKVHPAVGVARVGNSPYGFFIGPELPGEVVPPDGGYKDEGDIDNGIPPRVKRQAARFRVFGYDAKGKPVRELTAADGNLEWTVHVANKKAEWDRFDGPAGSQLPIGRRRDRAQWRNRDVSGTDEGGADLRARLVIDPGERRLAGPNRRARFDGGRVFDVEVPLGEAFTDDDGRLVVLGGFGRSGAWEPGRPITNYANNDRWYDDVSDGPVRARLTFADGRSLEAAPGWVVVAPPDFAPAVGNVVTLYDVMLEAAYELGLPRPAGRPSFKRDVYPLLERTARNAWVQARTAGGHGQGTGGAGDFLGRVRELADPGPASKALRKAVFARLRNPAADAAEAQAQATARYMPALSGDEGDAQPGQPGTWLALTRTQYATLRRWARGDFEADWDGRPPAAPEPSPEEYDRGPLLNASGGPFFPGIEAGWLVRQRGAYREPFRFDDRKLGPGDLTKPMAVPWQADFFECREHWWPAQRPDDVLPQAAYERLREVEAFLSRLGDSPDDEAVRQTLEAERAGLLARRVRWDRSLPQDSPAGDNAMVTRWSQLGFVVGRHRGETLQVGGRPVLVETEVGRYDGLSDAEYFHHLINIDRYPAFLPKARELARMWLAGARYGDSPFYAPFDYTPEAFARRLDDIYEAAVADMDQPYWLIAEGFSRAAVIENLRQKAPMNLVDGAWLQSVMQTGPADEVRARLFQIWVDEAGNGRTEWNHCNVYDTLLRQLNLFLPPIRTRAFIEQPFLPSAFTNPAFQLAVGLFPEEFLPELLGMTLYLEWEATPTLTPVVRALRSLDIDPLFYQLHVAIDNVTAGHGALARQAVELFLDRAREDGGERHVQDTWRRVWNGYVAWATIGAFGQELYEHLKRFDGAAGEDERRRLARERVLALVRDKAPYARTAHGFLAMSVDGEARPLNAWFAEPERLLEGLVQNGWVDLEHPRESRFFAELLAFSGRMYKVFSPEEEAVIVGWIESLRPSGPAQPPKDIATRAALALADFGARASTTAGHDGVTLPDTSGSPRPLKEWARGDVAAWMRALARSEYVAPGDPDQSRLFGEVFATRMPNVVTGSSLATLREWVRAGCPAPERQALALRAAPRAAPRRAEASFTARRLRIGAGSVH